MREVREVIHSASPSPGTAPARAASSVTQSHENLVIQRGFEGLDSSRQVSARIAAPPLGVPSPLQIERSITIPVSSADLSGRRRIRLVLDVTIDPQG
jgi:hypothetical protein